MVDTIKKAAELLLQGAKMLGVSCPQCQSPIFELKDGTMFCTQCNKKVVLENEDQFYQKGNRDEVHIGNPVQLKIQQLGDKLLKETDPNKILEIAHLIKKLENLLR